MVKELFCFNCFLNTAVMKLRIFSMTSVLSNQLSVFKSAHVGIIDT